MAKRKLKNCGRQRAFWGALVAGLGSLAGSIISATAGANAQREQIAEQRRIQEEQARREQAMHNADSINNYLSAVEPENYTDVVYKHGGKRKLRNNGVVITDGGYAIPIGKGTSLLQGSLHSEINESGNTGIGINAGGKEVEAENGEVIQKKGDELRVFSAQPILNGISPAEAVLNGENKNEVFKAQQAVKRKYHLRNGKSSPVERNKAKWGATFTTPDYIGLGTNIAGSLLSGIYANSLYNDLADSVDSTLPEYYDESFISGPTTYRNAAQRANVERNRLNARRSIARNTASSNISLGRMQESDTNAMYQLNELWDTKANKETEMRRTDIAREQEVRARNAAARRDWSNKVAEIKNNQLATKLGLRQAMIDSNVGMIQGIGSSVGNFLQAGSDRYQANQARIAQLAASPYGTAAKMHAAGYDFDDDVINGQISMLESRLDAMPEDNVKDYNAALSELNYWKRVQGKPQNKYSLRKNTPNNYSPLMPKENSLRYNWYKRDFE